VILHLYIRLLDEQYVFYVLRDARHLKQEVLSVCIAHVVQSVRCVTKPHPKSWIAINLKDVKVRPTHYLLRHYSSWDTEALRYWNFEVRCVHPMSRALRVHNVGRLVSINRAQMMESHGLR